MHAYRDQYAQLFHDGRNVVLIAISVDLPDTLAAWARDDEFPYLFASDSGSVIGKTYGAHNAKYGLDNRNLFVVGPDGKIAHVMPPCRVCSPRRCGTWWAPRRPVPGGRGGPRAPGTAGGAGRGGV